MKRELSRSQFRVTSSDRQGVLTDRLFDSGYSLRPTVYSLIKISRVIGDETLGDEWLGTTRRHAALEQTAVQTRASRSQFRVTSSDRQRLLTDRLFDSGYSLQPTAHSLQPKKILHPQLTHGTRTVPQFKAKRLARHCDSPRATVGGFDWESLRFWLQPRAYSLQPKKIPHPQVSLSRFATL